MSKLLCQHETHITYIIINNPQKRNAVDNGMSKEIMHHLQEAEAKQQRAVVIKSNTVKGVFTAGHDLSDLLEKENISDDPMFEMFNVISELSLPVIIQADGDLYAGGVMLLMYADLVYTTSNVKLHMTANKLGLPLPLLSYRKWLSVMGSHKAKELFFTAAPMTAKDAHCANIINDVFDTPEALADKVQNVCQQIIDCSSVGVANSKKQINALASQIAISYQSAGDIEAEKQAIIHSDETQSRVTALLNSLHKH